MRALTIRFYEVSTAGEKIQNESKLSFTTDGYTSIQNRRYLNVNVYPAGGFYNLGLGRACGTMLTETMVKVLDKQFEESGIYSSRGNIYC